MEHSEILFGPYLYPCGFPLILSVVYFFAGMNFVIMKWVCALFFIASLPLIYRIFKNSFNEKKYAFVIVICIALHWYFLTFTDNVLSDLPFFFFSLFSLFLMERSRTVVKQILLGVVIFYAYLIRDIGIVLIPTLFVFQVQQLIREKLSLKKMFLQYSIPYIIFIFLFILNTWLLPQGGANHYSMVSDLSFTSRFFVYYTELLSSYLFDCIIPGYLWIPILLLIIAGMYYQGRKSLHILFYVLSVYVICILWPSKQGIRFLFPIIPFILYFMIRGVLMLSTAIKFKYLNILIFVFAALIVFQSQKRVIRFSREDTNTVQTSEMQELYDSVISNTNENDKIVFENPRVLRLFTDRNSFFSTNNDTIRAYADYVVMKRDEPADLPWLKGISDTKKYSLYKVEKEKSD
jgi:hypothetical protein